MRRGWSTSSDVLVPRLAQAVTGAQGGSESGQGGSGGRSNTPDAPSTGGIELAVGSTARAASTCTRPGLESHGRGDRESTHAPDHADKKVIVTNPLRSQGRLASDVAHEVSHLLLEHQLAEVREVDGVPFRTCKPDEEEQATALGGTLLLPRTLLVAAAQRGEGPAAIAERCGVTVEMARYRFNATGVARQLARRTG